jgi:flagellar biogenesis protein FliO
MRLSPIALLAPFVLASTAAADPAFELVERDGAIEIIAHDMTATSTKIVPIRSRLELPLDGKPVVPALHPKDATVIAVELDGTSARRLSIKLGHSRETVAALAGHARAVQVGADLHVMIPRKVPAAGAAVLEPTVRVSEPPAAPEVVAPVVEAPAPPPAPAPVATPTPVTTKPPIATAPPAQSPFSQFSTIAALALAGIGCVGWVLRKRRKAQGSLSTIEVIAQRSLGGKARVVWLSAGPRELLVSVTPQQVRVIGQWKAGEAVPVLPTAQISNPGTDEPLAPSAPKASAAVAGLLKLRAHHAPQVTAEVATDDVQADAAWAREILAASSGLRR